MHYKIASFILNASKHQTGSREVYIAQPDSNLENLAGRVFLLAEIGGKKTEAKKAIDFIIDNINHYYYQDEKIFLQDKIEGLSLDNIFEAAVTKINKALLEFLNTEKIFLHPEESSIILGLIFEDRLFFTNFGSNKAFLIHARNDQFELINVEASAADVKSAEDKEKDSQVKFFSSVISGKIPPASYFLFCNEVLVEYLSNKELINIISKLPPMVAAEQIKTTLAKLNSFVPFLAIIIKNTYGLTVNELKDEANIESLRSAHNSISYLNSTEENTEKLLSPSGLINWSKLTQITQRISDSIRLPKKNKKEKTKIIAATEDPELKQTILKTKSLNQSHLIKEKIIAGRRHSGVFKGVKIIWSTLINILNPTFWKRAYQSMRHWLQNLHPRNKYIFLILLLILVLLVLSLWWTAVNNRKKVSDELFNNSMSALELKKNMLDAYLLYDNLDGAKTLIGEIISTLDELDFRTEDQKRQITDLKAAVTANKARVQKLISIDNPEQIFDFNQHNQSAEARNLIYADNKLFVADPLAKALYFWDFNDSKADSFLLSGEISSLDKPVFDNDANLIYYLNNNSLISVDPKSGRQNILNINGLEDNEKIDAFKLYLGRLYTLSSSNNQIYRFNRVANTFSNRSSWLQDDVLLANAVDLAINGDIVVLRNDAQIEALRSGEKKDFKLEDVDPALDAASFIKYSNNRFFIFDNQSKRLVVFDNEGSLLQQYRLPSLTNLKDFTLSSDNKNAFFLNDNAVYKIDLNLD
ncbi:MAG: hypothetical protein RBT30_01650 [Patescibacteria group bacterium]|jgi:hypothetical protein|nr:hypothetical protein [Patescibacteria group bacterium]